MREEEVRAMTERPKLRPFTAWDLITVLGLGVIIGALGGINAAVMGAILIAAAWAMGFITRGPKSPEKGPEKPQDEKKG